MAYFLKKTKLKNRTYLAIYESFYSPSKKETAHKCFKSLGSVETIIRIYGKRWDIEVFFKICKSYLNQSKECRSISYDAMTAHTAIVFTRYMMLSLENRESNDIRSMGELFLYFSDEMSDITWIQAFQMLRTLLADKIDISDEKIDELVDAFMDAIPTLLKSKLQAA